MLGEVGTPANNLEGEVLDGLMLLRGSGEADGVALVILVHEKMLLVGIINRGNGTSGH